MTLTNQERKDKAIALAQEALETHKRGNGAPFMDHVHAVARIAEQEIGLDQEAVIAVYLHEASRLDRKAADPEAEKQRSQRMLETIGTVFGADSYRLVEGLNRIAAIPIKDTRLKADIYRKLIVSYSTDPRVTLLKLADRLEVMRSLADCYSQGGQIRRATETFMLYAPLAHQLGLYRIQREMEDLAFKTTQPEDYRLVTNNVRANEIELMGRIKRFVKPLEKELYQAGIKYELKTRAKATYSIWKKMQVQQVGVDGVFDILAIRFIVDAPPETEKDVCWQVYSIVTHLYEPIPERMRDWISTPKASGYESLHITIKTPDGTAVEVQIRSRRMDLVAEYGVAAHWAYKGVSSQQALNQWLNTVRKRLQSDDPMTPEDETFAPNEIYVFTPNEDLRRLPKGATLLDFAFDIHSNLGIKCTGGRINGKMAQLRDLLQTGDVVEIFTAKNQKPSADWLNFVISGKAKTKIRQKLREEAGVQDTAGRELLERRFKNWKVEPTPEVIGNILKHFKYKQISDFYAAIASESLPMQDVKDFILGTRDDKAEPTAKAEEVPAADTALASPNKHQDYLIIDDRLGRIGFKLAKCCNPVIGDPVFGFVSIKEGVKIHRMSCPNAARLMTQYPYRIQKVKWRHTETTATFQVAIRFTAFDEMGLTQAVGQILQNLSLNLRSFTFSNQRGKMEGRLQVAVNSNKQIDVLLFQLRKIKGMVKVSRE